MTSFATTDVLHIAYDEYGPADGCADGAVVILMHGFPYDVHAYDDVAALLAADGCRVIVPFMRGYGPTRFVHDDTQRSGQQGAFGADLVALMDALSIESAVLAGYDWGGRAACVVAALWPLRCRGLVTAGGYNVQDIARSGEPLPPAEEHLFWYQWYFNTERGRAGLSANRREFCRLLWDLWSPTWAFDDATFEATAAAFDNPDFVDVVIHSYRHRYALVAGDPAYDSIEASLAAQPPITVPTVVLISPDDGVDPGDPNAASKPAEPEFTGPVEVRVVAGGHNVPQEQPEAFAAAIRSLL